MNIISVLVGSFWFLIGLPLLFTTLIGGFLAILFGGAVFQSAFRDVTHYKCPSCLRELVSR